MTRISGFLDDAVMNVPAVDALEAIKDQLEVAQVALYHLAGEVDARDELRPVLTTLLDTQELIEALVKTARIERGRSSRSRWSDEPAPRPSRRQPGEHEPSAFGARHQSGRAPRGGHGPPHGSR